MLRFKQGPRTATAPYEADATFGAVKASAAAALGVAVSGLTLWAGFPPKRLDGEDAAPASAVGIRAGLQLDVRSEPPSAAGAAAAGGAGAAAAVGAGGSAPSPRPVAPAIPVAPAAAASSWICPACTFSNAATRTRCEMCDTAGPVKAPVVVSKKMVRHVVDADNNCLFTATGWANDESRHLMSHGNDLRRRVAGHIRDHPELFTEAVLGRKPAEYVTWLLDPEHWGGGVELAVLSSLLSSEVVAIDIRSGAPLVFGEDKGYSRRLFLIYDGEPAYRLVVQIDHQGCSCCSRFVPVRRLLVLCDYMLFSDPALTSAQFDSVLSLAFAFQTTAPQASTTTHWPAKLRTAPQPASRACLPQPTQRLWVKRWL